MRVRARGVRVPTVHPLYSQSTALDCSCVCMAVSAAPNRLPGLPAPPLVRTASDSFSLTNPVTCERRLRPTGVRLVRVT